MSGGFNAGIADSFIKSFCENYGLISPVKKTTRFKNPENSSSIDLILTNKPQSFIKTGIIEKSLSDFHKLVTKVMKCTSQNLKQASLLIGVTRSSKIKS